MVAVVVESGDGDFGSSGGFDSGSGFDSQCY